MLALHVLAMDSEGKIFGHDAILINGIYASFFQCLCKGNELFVFVKLSSEHESSCPGIDGSHAVRTRFVALLVLAIVSRHCAMRSFRLHDETISKEEEGESGVVRWPMFLRHLSYHHTHGVTSSDVIIPRDPNP